MIGFFRNKTVPLADQWTRLKEAGITVNEGISLEHLMSGKDKAWFEEKPYVHLLIALGGQTLIEEEWANHTSNIWYVDLKAVEDTDIYTQLAERMVQMTDGALEMKHIRSCVDHEKRNVLFSFIYQGERIEWNLEYKNEWIDKSFFDYMIALDRKRNPERQFVASPQDHHLLIAYIDQKQFKQLNKWIKPEFELWNNGAR